MHQVIRESPSGHGFPGFQANMVVRTPYLRSVSLPGHGSALPWSERGAREYIATQKQTVFAIEAGFS